MPSFIINGDGSVTQTTASGAQASPGRLALFGVPVRVIDPGTNTDSEQLAAGLGIVGRRIESTLVSLGIINATPPAPISPPSGESDADRLRAVNARIERERIRREAIRPRQRGPLMAASYPPPGAMDP